MADPGSLVARRIAEHSAVVEAMRAEAPLVAAIAQVVGDALGAGNKVLLCGNGGSAADATHLAAELVGRFLLERRALPALSLTENGSTVTAVGNDYAYERVFARQVEGLGRPGDVLVALSTSGGSGNVLAAVEAAAAGGMRTVALTGTPGGRLAEVCELALRVPATETARIQEGYMLAGHIVCELVEQALFGDP